MNLFRTASASIFFLLGVSAGVAQQTSPPVATPNGVSTGAVVGAAAPPRCDANCVRANASKASEACAPRIEAQSPTDFDWISRPTPGIFQQAEPSSPADAVVRYRGDSVRFMDMQKTWVRVSYECAYDVASGSVVSVNVRAGRLDQPLSSEDPVNASAAAGIPARLPQQQAMSQQQAAAQPAGTRRPRPHVWEPSRVEIQQQSPNPRR
ncbi:hypothetical protein [Hyphomicrobium sp.]|jgi:hypothetical protein|uniref:hypothetical protein n=1 Tax=Hyphomicrobium sp. TaxID=82 RepID=UPI00356508A9